MKLDAALQSLSALAQATRLAIFRHLMRAGPAGESAGAIAAALRTPPPTLSFHLKDLEHAGLITQRREGRSLIYAADFDSMRQLLSFLMDDCCNGRPEVCGFAALEKAAAPISCSPDSDGARR